MDTPTPSDETSEVSPENSAQEWEEDPNESEPHPYRITAIPNIAIAINFDFFIVL